MPVADTGPTRAWARLRMVRNLADQVVRSAPSAKRSAARYRVRRALLLVASEHAVLGPAVRPRADGRVRRLCPMCGCEMAPRGAGRPATACASDACRELVMRLRDLARILPLQSPADLLQLTRAAREWAREVG